MNSTNVPNLQNWLRLNKPVAAVPKAPSFTRRQAQDGDDRRDLSEGAPHGIEPDGKKGKLGRLMGRAKGGMN